MSQWTEAPQPAGVIVTNPPYGERISVEDMGGLYETIGNKLKRVFQGYHAWIIGYQDEHFKKIGLAVSQREPMLNGALECELREYVIFDGDYKTFRSEGGTLKNGNRAAKTDKKATRRVTDKEWKMEARRKGFGGKEAFDPKRKEKRSPLEDRYKSTKRRFADSRPDKREDTTETALGRRRNEMALRSIQGKQPSLPPTDGRIMRSRGWKRNGIKPSDNSSSSDNNE